jgi:hypothetical protein
MRTLILLIICACVSYHSFAQKKLAIYKTFGGVIYEMDTLTLSTKQVAMVLMHNPEAYREFKLARRNSATSSVLGFVGAALIAVPLVTAVAGGQPEWIVAAGGAGLLLASVPFSSSFKGHANNAIDIYNSKLNSEARLKSTLYLTGSSASIILKF